MTYGLEIRKKGYSTNLSVTKAIKIINTREIDIRTGQNINNRYTYERGLYTYLIPSPGIRQKVIEGGFLFGTIEYLNIRRTSGQVIYSSQNTNNENNPANYINVLTKLEGENIRVSLIGKASPYGSIYDNYIKANIIVYGIGIA